MGPEAVEDVIPAMNGERRGSLLVNRGTATAEEECRQVYLVWVGATCRGRHVASWPRRKRIVAIWLFIIEARW